MNRNKILQSNLLDIIFDNRNKEYGAYVLRRDYDNRLTKAMVTMLGAVIVFAVWMYFRPSASVDINMNNTGPITLESYPNQPEQPKPVVQKQIQPVIKDTRDMVPFISKDSIKHDTKPLIPDPGPGIASDQPPGDHPPGNNGGGGGGGGADTSSHKTVIPVVVVPPVDKTKAIYSPDIMPEFPGGVQALLKYFKRNLAAPEDISEGEMIKVKVNFIVKYDGTLAGFNVLQSGGEAFDKEVIRVLKKMPNWIPGKTSGQDVSVYFTVPVVFTSQE